MNASSDSKRDELAARMAVLLGGLHKAGLAPRGVLVVSIYDEDIGADGSGGVDVICTQRPGGPAGAMDVLRVALLRWIFESVPADLRDELLAELRELVTAMPRGPVEPEPRQGKVSS